MFTLVGYKVDVFEVCYRIMRVLDEKKGGEVGQDIGLSRYPKAF